MYICLCRGVSEGNIKKIVDEGVSSLEGIKEACSAGSDCGSCVNRIKVIIDQHRTETHSQNKRSRKPSPA